MLGKMVSCVRRMIDLSNHVGLLIYDKALKLRYAKYSCEKHATTRSDENSVNPDFFRSYLIWIYIL